VGWAPGSRQTVGRNQLKVFQRHSVRKPRKEQSKFCPYVSLIPSRKVLRLLISFF
jgi:hypothetical protein